jgi:iron complex transport system ATP-binding protein
VTATRTAIEARIGSVRLGGRQVLGPIALAVPAGAWTAVVGPNGAGKSTLLRTLAGLQRLAGEVLLDGRPLPDWPAETRARALAWLGQAQPGGEDLLVRDVVMLGRLPHQPWLAAPSAADRAAVDAAMQTTRCRDWADRPLGSLSGGERQRVLLARAVAVQAPVLLMDEPLSHLDPPQQADWIALVRDEAARGVAVVSVLHELSIALQADTLVVMADGRVRHHGAPADPATREALQQVFEDRLELVEVAGRWLALPAAGRGAVR